MEHLFLMFLDHTQRRSTVGRTPLDEWQLVAETSTWQHTTLTTDKYPCPRWDSNPRCQQASGHRHHAAQQQKERRLHLYSKVKCDINKLRNPVALLRKMEQNAIIRESKWNKNKFVEFAVHHSGTPMGGGFHLRVSRHLHRLATCLTL